MYEGVSGGQPDVQVVFNAKQDEAFRALRSLPGGLGLFQGPPGTGKTFWLVHVLLPILTQVPSPEGKVRQVMLIGPSNEVVDHLAQTMDAVIQQHFPRRGLLVTRCHSMATEEELAWAPAVRERPRPTDARPPILDASENGDDLLDSLVLARLVADFYAAETSRPAGVADRRVKQTRLSLGHRMLQLAGVIEEPWSQPGKYVQFCEFFDQYRTGHEFPKDTLQIFRERTRELRDHVLAISNVVVATAFAVGAMPVRDNVRPTVIAIDEAARLAEPELWLTLAWCNPKATLLIGDHQQLRPLVFSRPRENPFAHQLQISLFTRLKLNGFMDIMFTEQHRMVGGLCRMVSSVFYESKLVTAAILEDTVEQTFGMVRRYNGQVFRKGQSLTFLDVSDAEDERDCRQGSRINPKFAAIVYALINDLLHSTQIAANQIAVLTPYRGQLHLYLNLFRSNDRFRGVRVHTIDSFQGCESPVVIFDTTATSRLQFLADPNRLNVGVSRARSGMYIIGDWKQLAQPKTRCASEKHHIAAISRLMAHLRSKGCRTPIPQAWVPVISEVMHAEIWVPTNGAEDASW